MVYQDLKYLSRRTDSCKLLRNKAFKIVKIPNYPNYDGCKRRLALMFHNFFDKKSSGGAVTRLNNSAVRSELIPNQQFDKGLCKPTSRKFKKQKVHSSFKGNIRVLI